MRPSMARREEGGDGVVVGPGAAVGFAQVGECADGHRSAVLDRAPGDLAQAQVGGQPQVPHRAGVVLRGLDRGRPGVACADQRRHLPQQAQGRIAVVLVRRFGRRRAECGLDAAVPLLPVAQGRLVGTAGAQVGAGGVPAGQDASGGGPTQRAVRVGDGRGHRPVGGRTGTAAKLAQIAGEGGEGSGGGDGLLMTRHRFIVSRVTVPCRHPGGAEPVASARLWCRTNAYPARSLCRASHSRCPNRPP